MGSSVDYDKHYAKGRDQCGPPFKEFVEFFSAYPRHRARVLDLGCGQGRDALLAARLGHEVVGVDLSALGIRHLLEDATSEELDVQGVVSDVLDYRSRKKFDVVILDRVLHLLLSDSQRERCLTLAARLTRKRGHVLVADTPNNRALIHDFFDAADVEWTILRRSKNFLFARKL